MNKEEISIKISKTLNGLCPSFTKKENSAAEWHKCDCKITENSCECVWHITDTCLAGTWEELSFIEKYINEKEKLLIRTKKAIINKEPEIINSRFEILDIRED